MGIITLTTDFGSRDGYVAAMKGVILGIHPSVTIVDVSHEIEPGNVRAAALLLGSCREYFPVGTVHVIVVDPGVGSRRKVLCLRAGSSYFVAPDNGVLTPFIRSSKKFSLREITNPRVTLRRVSSTFHGRDVMAPAAAILSRNGDFAEMGREVRKYEMIHGRPVLSKGDKVIGEVVHIDRFGDVITNIEAKDIKKKREECLVRIGNRMISHWASCYADAKKGRLMALINSWGCVEIAVFQGSAAKVLNARIGQKVVLI